MTKKTKHIPRVPLQNVTCKGKIPYTSITSALEARTKLSERVPDRKFNIYICSYCGEYHIGGAQEEQK